MKRPRETDSRAIAFWPTTERRMSFGSRRHSSSRAALAGTARCTAATLVDSERARGARRPRGDARKHWHRTSSCRATRGASPRTRSPSQRRWRRRCTRDRCTAGSDCSARRSNLQQRAGRRQQSANALARKARLAPTTGRTVATRAHIARRAVAVHASRRAEALRRRVARAITREVNARANRAQNTGLESTHSANSAP